MNKILLTLLTYCIYATSWAQIHFSDSLQISLLTADPGPNAYDCFGHTGIRILDLKQGQDIVFHYGVYNYSEPNFIWHFVQGKCNYKMGGAYTSDFLDDYKYRRINVTEQVLDLDTAQANQLTQALLINYLPQNRNYRYSYLFDNCATRPFSMLYRWVPVNFDTTWVQPITFRDMIHEMTGQGNWLDFGIAIAVAQRADDRALFAEQMFLPKYLCKAIDYAQTDGHALAKETITHRNRLQSESAEIKNELGQGKISPMLAACLLLIICIVLTGLRFVFPKQNKWQILLRIFDSFWLLATGLAGCIVWFLNFFSEHPAVDNNLNCWWLLPTNLLFIAIIWIKKAEKVRCIYFFIIFAAEFIYIIMLGVCQQYCHPAFIPLLVLIAIRSAALCIETKKYTTRERQE